MFLSRFLLFRYDPNTPGPHRFWKRRRVLSLCGHFYGRRRRCYRIAVRGLHRSFLHTKYSRKNRVQMLRRIWGTRVEAACRELNTSHRAMRDTLKDVGIGLDQKSLQHLAIWEPRTFRSLAMLTRFNTQKQGLNSLEPPPTGVVTRGML